MPRTIDAHSRGVQRQRSLPDITGSIAIQRDATSAGGYQSQRKTRSGSMDGRDRGARDITLSNTVGVQLQRNSRGTTVSSIQVQRDSWDPGSYDRNEPTQRISRDTSDFNNRITVFPRDAPVTGSHSVHPQREEMDPPLYETIYDNRSIPMQRGMKDVRDAAGQHDRSLGRDTRDMPVSNVGSLQWQRETSDYRNMDTRVARDNAVYDNINVQVQRNLREESISNTQVQVDSRAALASNPNFRSQRCVGETTVSDNRCLQQKRDIRDTPVSSVGGGLWKKNPRDYSLVNIGSIQLQMDTHETILSNTQSIQMQGNTSTTTANAWIRDQRSTESDYQLLSNVTTMPDVNNPILNQNLAMPFGWSEQVIKVQLNYIIIEM
jgi:hypothetical protein